MTIRTVLCDKPIRTKVNAAILIVILGILVLDFVFLTERQREMAWEGMRVRCEDLTGVVAYNLSPILNLDDSKTIEKAVKGAFEDEDLYFVRILRYQYNDTLFFPRKDSAESGHDLASIPEETTSIVWLGEDYLLVTLPIKVDQKLQGLLTMSFSLKRLNLDMAHQRKWNFVLSFLILMCGIGAARYLSGLLTKPIRNLTEASVQLSEGGWETEIPVENSDEIGVLAVVLNRLRESLKESKGKLEEYGYTLEQKVEERTSALRSANERLAADEATITSMLEDLHSVNRDLTQTKNQLENIFKSVVDRAIITIDSQGKIGFYSKTSELIFGYEAFEVVGKKSIQEFFVQDNDFVFILLEHTREAGIYKGEAELMRRSKQIFPAIVTITPLKGEHGALTGYTIIVEDITEKKKTEENIRLLSLAVESATDGVAVSDLESKIVFVNRSFAKMHGYVPFEVTGKSFKDSLPESYLPLIDQIIQQIYTEGNWTGELEEPRKDKSTFPAQISASLIKDPQGRPVGILAIFKDISEKKKLEQEILQSNRELAALNTIASTVSRTLNLQETLNRSLKIILELTRSSVGWILLVDRGEKTRMRLVAHQGLSENLAEEESEHVEENCLCWEVVKTKKPRILDVSACPRFSNSTGLKGKSCYHLSIPLRSKDEVLGVMNLRCPTGTVFSDREMKFFSSVGNEIGMAVDNALLFEDVEKTKEKLQKLNRKLEEASQIKSEFLANTSHELRTPLNSIIGFLGLILDGYCVDRDEEREFMKNTQQSAKQLLCIINDVLDLAKIEAGRMELELGEVELNTLFEEVQSLTGVQAQQKKLKLSFSHENHPPPKVYADPGKLKQVLINLVGNAIKFTDTGKITVRSIVQEKRGNVLIEVEDTGIGIPAAAQSKLFEKFRQVDGSSTRKYGGTGLGLTITKNLVEMMGGKIKLVSLGRERGTKVSFTVPIYRETENGESLHRSEMVGQIRGEKKGSLALIAEDDPLFGRYLDEVLQAEGYSTILTNNADDAVTLAKDLHPRVVLLDFSLPQKLGGQLKDGKQIIQILQKDPATRDIPIIIITGQDLEIVENDLSTCELDLTPPVLLKPVDPEILLRNIRDFSRKEDKEIVGMRG